MQRLIPNKFAQRVLSVPLVQRPQLCVLSVLITMRQDLELKQNVKIVPKVNFASIEVWPPLVHYVQRVIIVHQKQSWVRAHLLNMCVKKATIASREVQAWHLVIQALTNHIRNNLLAYNAPLGTSALITKCKFQKFALQDTFVLKVQLHRKSARLELSRRLQVWIQ